MTKYDVIELAQKAGFVEYELDDGTTNAFDVRYARFANLVAAHKAEVITAEAYRCGYKDGMAAAAVICENLTMQQDRDVRDECATAIRARGENT